MRLVALKRHQVISNQALHRLTSSARHSKLVLPRMRIPRDVDKRSELMSITIPK